MSSKPNTYDVVIAGGGPAGSTLAAVLARDGFSVAVFESERFPREHIGESFSHRVISAIQESGALRRVLDSECYVVKYGGYYAWSEVPSVALFEHSAWERDGILRWAIHCNRSEFDAILLEHAASRGAAVTDGCGVERVEDSGAHKRVHLSDGTSVTARFFVDASGRVTGLANRRRKSFLSRYKNIAIWTHVLGGKPAQSIDAPWNVFHRLDVSSIANFAFPDGWFWYIPVPKIVDGQRVLTHSVGLVTDPRVLKQPGKDYTDVSVLLAAARAQPILSDLIRDCAPVQSEVSTATNYSMISSELCSFDDAWLAVGDAAYFVDPLFSSGAAFATNQALCAGLLLRSYFDAGLSETLKRDLFRDYDVSWRRIALSFALVLDQWYYAIAKSHSDSIYWSTRADDSIPDVRTASFNALVDTAVSPDLLQVMTDGRGGLELLGAEGPLPSVLAQRDSSDDVWYQLAPEIGIRPSLSLGAGRSKDDAARQRLGEHAEDALRSYWADPVLNGGDVPPIYAAPLEAEVISAGNDSQSAVTFIEARDHGHALVDALRAGVSKDDLEQRFDERQRGLLRRLLSAGLAIASEGRGR